MAAVDQRIRFYMDLSQKTRPMKKRMVAIFNVLAEINPLNRQMPFKKRIFDFDPELLKNVKTTEPIIANDATKKRKRKTTKKMEEWKQTQNQNKASSKKNAAVSRNADVTVPRRTSARFQSKTTEPVVKDDTEKAIEKEQQVVMKTEADATVAKLPTAINKRTRERKPVNKEDSGKTNKANKQAQQDSESARPVRKTRRSRKVELNVKKETDAASEEIETEQQLESQQQAKEVEVEANNSSSNSKVRATNIVDSIASKLMQKAKETADRMSKVATTVSKPRKNKNELIKVVDKENSPPFADETVNQSHSDYASDTALDPSNHSVESHRAAIQYSPVELDSPENAPATDKDLAQKALQSHLVFEQWRSIFFQNIQDTVHC